MPPALLISSRIGPREAASTTNRSMSAGSVRSHTTCGKPKSSGAPLCEQVRTSNPCLCAERHRARPIPRVPPVMTATPRDMSISWVAVAGRVLPMALGHLRRALRDVEPRIPVEETERLQGETGTVDRHDRPVLRADDVVYAEHVPDDE